MPDLSTLVAIATGAITAAVVLLNIIAPLTSTTKDDAILGFLRWVETALAKIVLPTAGKKTQLTPPLEVRTED